MRKVVESRKSEIRYITSDPARMLNKFIARSVLKTWMEEFVDENTGKIVSIERNEILFEKGTLVDNDVLMQIRFWQEEGSVKDVEVSNQKRMSFVRKNQSLFPYKSVVKINDKRHSFLLYATSVQNALTILTDYIELNYNGGFTVSDIKELEYCIVLIDNLKTKKQRNDDINKAYLKNEISLEEFVESGMSEETLNEAEDSSKLKFYQIIARIVSHDDKEGDDEENGTFIVQTYTAVRANMLIKKYLLDQQEKQYQEALKHPERTFIKREINSFIEESKTIPIGRFIPVEFSQVYEYETTTNNN
ncbi:RNA polymerase subunit sigma [Barnesiella propionica]|uniref:RNA polymerase subunit sigma n=1 Tax=Barnesiella propionica TaxID=2981781 RepID=UPI0021D16258|nr:RNA polymerase subunit sigma [Barnesiella propionica]MCU6767382.1 RNA polymerase subunit sigma [Barnesiella propionica]